MNKPEQEFLDHLLYVRNYSKKTVSSYQEDIDLFCEFISHIISARGVAYESHRLPSAGTARAASFLAAEGRGLSRHFTHGVQ